MKLVSATDPKQPNLYYGAACQPNVKGYLWECADRAEYNRLRDEYEAAEGNCNTCINLQRPTGKVARREDGYLSGTCKACVRCGPFTFHPEDPDQLRCHVQRMRTKP